MNKISILLLIIYISSIIYNLLDLLFVEWACNYILSKKFHSIRIKITFIPVINTIAIFFLFSITVICIINIKHLKKYSNKP